jgi:hypothetical protein
MTRELLFLASSLLAAPPAATRVIPLRVERGQEFVYFASYERRGDKPGAQLLCQIVSHVLILDVDQTGIHAAFMTEQRDSTKTGAEPSHTVRLELARIAPSGRVHWEPVSLAPRLPIDRPPTLELFPFLELPTGELEPGQTWRTEDPDTGPMEWRALMLERRERGRCLKLLGEQASPGWYEPGRFVWRRKETVSVLLQEGFVDHAERELTWRSESGELYHSTTVIDLYALPAPIPQGEFRARRADIRAAMQFSARLNELLRPRGEPDYRGYDDLLKAMDRHTDHGTPYATAIHALKKQAQLARAGERPPEPIVIRAEVPSHETYRNQNPHSVPDIELADSTTGLKVSFAAYRGRPSVLLFVRPQSRLNPWILDYAKAAATSYTGRVHLLVFVVGDLAEDSKQLKERYQLQVPIFDGKTLWSIIRGSTTPMVVVVDEVGKIRWRGPGWGGEYPDLIHKELLDILKRKP